MFCTVIKKMNVPFLLLLTLPIFLPTSAHAGLYYSGETYAELPARWRGFLLDQRTLRNIAVEPVGLNPASPARVRYLEKVAELESNRPANADEWADLGALYIRLGKLDKAIAVLRDAQRKFPGHFAIVANLGTAWQLQGDLQQAAQTLQQAVRLAPAKMKATEELHLKLVRQRLQKKDGLDDLFGVRYLGARGEYTPGAISDVEKEKLPGDALALAQQLALWLPADGRLLWQLAELASAHGDVKTAAAMMDGCVTSFGMQDRELRRHRQLMRETADEQARVAGPTVNGKDHPEKHQLAKFRSKRPLLSKFQIRDLPPIRDDGVNPLPWELVNETTVDRKFSPTFPDHLKKLDGKQVTLTGFMQPLVDAPEFAVFMLIEYPVGCWYCEMPETTGIFFVEMPADKTAVFSRNLIRVTGRLQINSTDPEDFLYALRDAQINGVD